MKDIDRRIVINFMDILILTELERRPTVSGYDVITFIHKEFGMLVSSGTVYSILYSLERNKLVNGTCRKKKRVYSLTDKGKKALDAIMGTKEELQRLIARIFRTRCTAL